MKKYTYKVYGNTGKYITSWDDASFDSFRKTINGGLGECRIKLARKFDDFGENNDVKLNNRVEIICSDGDTASSGLKIYSGFISSYSPFIDGNNEGVEVVCLGYVSKLATSILKSGTSIEMTTNTAQGLDVSSDASSSNIHNVVDSIIDQYQTESLNPIVNYDTTSNDVNPNSITYTFNAKTYKDALEICRQYSPANWWWFVGADNILQFKLKPSLATHKFVFGKHFKSIKVEKNMENVVNRVLFSSNPTGGGQILKLYQDADSGEDFDDRWEVISDNRVSVSATADNAGASTLAEKKDADVKTVIEILDNNGNANGYDIESINPGDTCKFLNLNTITSQTFSGNMTIKSVDYTSDKVVIEVESLKVSIGREIIDNKKRIEEQEASGRASSYDTDTNGYTPWTSSVGGATGVSQANQYTAINATIILKFGISGTSDDTDFTFTLPFNAKRSTTYTGFTYSDNGVISANPAKITTTAGSNVATCYPGHNASASGWTGSGSKSIGGVLIYERDI